MILCRMIVPPVESDLDRNYEQSYAQRRRGTSLRLLPSTLRIGFPLAG